MGSLVSGEEFKVAPCVGCGYCCKKAVCYIGVISGMEGPPCSGLVWKDDRYWCQLALEATELKSQLVEDPDEWEANIERDLAIGAGCSSSLFNTDRNNMLRRKAKEEKDYVHVRDNY